MKIQRVEVAGNARHPAHVRHLFFCPGCKQLHGFTTDSPSRPNWTFNGDAERPTFSPSLLVSTSRPRAGLPDDPSYDMKPEDWERVTLCHLFVKDGRIEYLGDCPHELAGKTVDMVEIPPGQRW